MTTFPVIVDAATAAIALDSAAAQHIGVLVVFGDEEYPSAVLNLHPKVVADGLHIYRRGIRATDPDSEIIGFEWAAGAADPDGDPALIIRTNGELVLTHGHFPPYDA